MSSLRTLLHRPLDPARARLTHGGLPRTRVPPALGFYLELPLGSISCCLAGPLSCGGGVFIRILRLLVKRNS